MATKLRCKKLREINKRSNLMTINEDTVKGKWLEIKGEVQKAWGKLTADELDQTKGDIKAIAGLVQQKYGEDKEKFQKKFSSIMDKFKSESKTKVAQIKKDLKK